jgi:hypothetical protein
MFTSKSLINLNTNLEVDALVSLGGYIWQQSSSLAFAIKARDEGRITAMDYTDK